MSAARAVTRCTAIVIVLSLAGCMGAVRTMSFGTGGSGCEVVTPASSFPAGQEVRTIATFQPPLETGTEVIVTVELNGTELDEHRMTMELTEPANCVFGTLPDLDPGRYRVEVGVMSGPKSLIAGDFEVTP